MKKDVIAAQGATLPVPVDDDFKLAGDGPREDASVLIGLCTILVTTKPRTLPEIASDQSSRQRVSLLCSPRAPSLSLPLFHAWS